jgi:hypothetical protein
VWWDERVILAEIAALSEKHPQRIWLDAGTAEGDVVIADARRLRDALTAKGWTLGDDLAYMEAEGGAHDEASWGDRIHLVLQFLFPLS